METPAKSELLYGDYFDSVIRNLMEEEIKDLETELKELKQTVQKYLTFNSADGNVKRQELRRVLNILVNPPKETKLFATFQPNERNQISA